MVSQRKRHSYQCTKAQSLTSEGMTEPFHILQDDTLTQYLFIIVVDYCIKLRMENTQILFLQLRHGTLVQESMFLSQKSLSLDYLS